MKNNRYPGVLPFEESQQLLFHGRNAEKEDLLHLIKAKDLGVVFAKSGIGKTSLMQAGVMPLLNDEDIYPIEVRFLDKKYTPFEHIRSALEPFMNQKLLQKYVPANQTPTLWQCLKACEFEAKDFLPLFVFDQFEEFFLHREADRKACSLQLAEMLNDRLPDNIRQQLRQINRTERTAEQLQWFSPLSVKMLFLIRSDKLSLMDEMSRQLPAILSNRYHLKPLQRTAAEDAILLPAQMQDADLWTQSFDYDDDTLDKILNYLSNEQGEIESFQLQILCQHLETQVKKRQDKGETNITIFPTDIGDMDDIQNQYYESKIAELPKSEQHKARQLIEEELIVENRRIGVDEVVLQKRFEITQAFLDELLQTRLIRREKNRLGNTYELSHDSLLEPIAKSREIRQAKEAIEKAERQAKELEEQKRKLEEERKLKEELQQALAEMKKQRDIAKAERQRANELNTKNEKMISAFYFYEGKYALTYKNGKFGFINKEGDIMIDYKYDKAEQFDNNGFAKVAKKEGFYNNVIVYYLIDTNGAEYKIAYKLKDLDESVMILNLREAKLIRFPNVILKHTQLKRLILRQNYRASGLLYRVLLKYLLYEIPKEIGLLKNLEYLSLNANQLKKIPKEIGLLKNLTRLYLVDNQLKEIPKEIGQLKNLTMLTLGHNQLKEIPKEIEQLKNLTMLTLGYNQLKEIPKEIGLLENLTALTLGSNQLKEIPKEIGLLKNLTILTLGSNQLKEIPKEIGQLKNLTRLYLVDNQLKEIPKEIEQLNNLKYLSISKNPIPKEEIEKLKKLLPNCEIWHDYE